MAEINTTADRSANIQKLQNTIIDLDALAYSGFSRIAALSRITLAAMETSLPYRFPENIVAVLKTIQELAEITSDGINYNAEETGCTYRDDCAQKRSKAYQEALREMKKYIRPPYLRISAEQQGSIITAINKRIDSLPQERRSKGMTACYGALKSKFHCDGYKELPRDCYDDAVKFIETMDL